MLAKPMATVEDALRTQIRSIEARYRRPMSSWIKLVRDRRLTKHGEILALLKTEFAMSHGDANRVALVARDAVTGSGPAAGGDPADDLYTGKLATLRPVHDRLMAAVTALGKDIEVAPKRGYVSLRRAKQFGMIQPFAGRVDVGLILKDVPAGGRLEKNPNAMFTHRVRVSRPEEVDAELRTWLKRAYDRS
jgi:Domain of unknown function (DUF5655)/Domain of unknown function (DUF4287)